ncbi:SDR family oxidoreductase [Hoeflea prorocentri]|uniref:SDR family NAD(P)-dependent oxidoreductase n=1 Tax=Hoeflea prorocentri TaxID=1922333 RepID=A0A9X3ZFW9_9HYPH|nr:SDR family oxidoreductase [Hoeflea prorocentri]MCY6380157.1 SDR family NAD(P)-dependent oxidoreductase [Hoeflea prorocentri]MDA5397957.1 SDR family NAD(P)-dependent oxidoreductase [Hoeflea prorocentri]
MDETRKAIIITGAGSGIGRSCARAFLDHGYRVGLIGRRIAPLQETADGHPDALLLPGDVTDPGQVEDIFSKAFESWGRIDVLFNNAGMGTPPRTIDETSVEDWLAVVNVNLTGTFLCARQAFRIMRSQSPQGGRIINNGSVSSYVPRPGSAPYTSTKHAVTGLTRTLSLDGRPFNIACGQIDIGNALTDMAMPMTTGVPQADGSISPEATMDVVHVASSVLHMAELPLDANVQFMTVMATTMPYIGRG